MKEEELYSSHLEIKRPSMREICNTSSSMETFDGECDNRHLSHHIALEWCISWVKSG